MDKFDKIQDILDNVVNQSWYQYSFKVKLIQTSWPGIVGEKLAGFTMPYRIYNQILYVRCSHQGWIQTLQFHKKNILEKIQDMLKNSKISVTDVRFTFGQLNKTQSQSSKKREFHKSNRIEVDKNNNSFDVLENLLDGFFKQ